jgi:phage major capsid protein E
MPINKRQAELLGVFAGVPVNTFNKYYLEKFNGTPFMTISDSFKLDDVIGELTTLSIVPRGTKAPAIKVNGFKRITIKPDIIKGTAAMTPLETLELQAGQTETIINGQVVDNRTLIESKKMAILKTGYENTKATMAAELYLNGKITLPVSGDEIDFGYAAPTAVEFKTSDDQWEVFLVDRITDYVRKNKMYPETIEVDVDILKAMMKNANLREVQKAYSIAELAPNAAKSLEQTYPNFNILNMRVTALVPAVDTKGNAIDTAGLMYLSSAAEFTNTYVGLEVANGQTTQMLKAEYFINEVVEVDPAGKKFIFQSGYCPIIPIPDRVMRWKVTIKAK